MSDNDSIARHPNGTYVTVGMTIICDDSSGSGTVAQMDVCTVSDYYIVIKLSAKYSVLSS